MFLSAAELLGVDKDGLQHALTTRTRQTPEGPIVSPLNVRAATENRDSLAKIVYSKMFDWLVAAINAAIGEDKNCAASVGVLDIYGFESFEYNDLEQFCINLANEKLQQHFNHHVFKQEQVREMFKQGSHASCRLSCFFCCHLLAATLITCEYCVTMAKGRGRLT